jgi:F-type H+-transporting ATPase subunit b
VELNWTTFSLEVINFLILAWILAHFFYRPVMRVITERQARIKVSLDEADQRHHEAEALKAEYEGRLTESERERETARAALRREIDAERAKALEALRQETEEAREKGRVIEEQRLDDTRRRVEKTALMQGASFTSRLLTRLASPELETRLIGSAHRHTAPPRRRRR